MRLVMVAGGVAVNAVHEVDVDNEIYEMADRKRYFGQ